MYVQSSDRKGWEQASKLQASGSGHPTGKLLSGAIKAPYKSMVKPIPSQIKSVSPMTKEL